jgi:hypothetical protein
MGYAASLNILSVVPMRRAGQAHRMKEGDRHPRRIEMHFCDSTGSYLAASPGAEGRCEAAARRSPGDRYRPRNLLECR